MMWVQSTDRLNHTTLLITLDIQHHELNSVVYRMGTLCFGSQDDSLMEDLIGTRHYKHTLNGHRDSLAKRTTTQIQSR